MTGIAKRAGGTWVAWALLAVAFLAPRLAVLDRDVPEPIGHHGVADEGGYSRNLRAWRVTGRWSCDHWYPIRQALPFGAMNLAATSLTGAHSLRTIRSCSVALSVLLAAGLGLFLDRTEGRRAAMALLAALAVNGVLFVQSTYSNVYILALVLTVASLVIGVRGGAMAGLGAGLVAGLAASINLQTYAIAALVLEPWWSPSRNRARLARVALVVAGAALPLLLLHQAVAESGDVGRFVLGQTSLGALLSRLRSRSFVAAVAPIWPLALLAVPAGLDALLGAKEVTPAVRLDRMTSLVAAFGLAVPSLAQVAWIRYYHALSFAVCYLAGRFVAHPRRTVDSLARALRSPFRRVVATAVALGWSYCLLREVARGLLGREAAITVAAVAAACLGWLTWHLPAAAVTGAGIGPIRLELVAATLLAAAAMVHVANLAQWYGEGGRTYRQALDRLAGRFAGGEPVVASRGEALLVESGACDVLPDASLVTREVAGVLEVRLAGGSPRWVPLRWFLLLPAERAQLAGSHPRIERRLVVEETFTVDPLYGTLSLLRWTPDAEEAAGELGRRSR